MAIEDAAVLTSLFGAIKTPGREVLTKVFDVYDRLRRERTQQLLTTSRECGLVFDFEAPGIKDNAKCFANNTSKRYDWIWGFDVEKSCEEGVAMLSEVES